MDDDGSFNVMTSDCQPSQQCARGDMTCQLTHRIFFLLTGVQILEQDRVRQSVCPEYDRKARFSRRGFFEQFTKIASGFVAEPGVQSGATG